MLASRRVVQKQLHSRGGFMRRPWLDRYPSRGQVICTAADGATPNEARSLRGVQELVGSLLNCGGRHSDKYNAT